MIVTYLLPTVWAGKVPMQYRIEKIKKDMRTRFCKDNERYIIDLHVLDAFSGIIMRQWDQNDCRDYCKRKQAAHEMSIKE